MGTDLDPIAGLAAAPDGSVVYFGQPSGLWALDTASAEIELVAGGGDDAAADPDGSDAFAIDLGTSPVVAVDPAGSVFVAARGVIYRLGDGNLTPVGDGSQAGNGALGALASIAAGTEGDVWFTTGNGSGYATEVGVIGGDGTTATAVAGEEAVTGIAATTGGAVYAFSWPPRTVTRIDGPTPEVVYGDGSTDVAGLTAADFPVPFSELSGDILLLDPLAAAGDELLVWTTEGGVLAVGSDGLASRIAGPPAAAAGFELEETVSASALLRHALLGATTRAFAGADGRRIWIAVGDASGILYEIEPGTDTARLVAGSPAG